LTDNCYTDTPKHVYKCDHPGCIREFVRADLCTRHKDRHTAKGSHLQRKDAFKTAPIAETSVSTPPSPSGKHTITSPPVEPAQSAYYQPHQREYYAAPVASRQASQPSSSDYTATHGHPNKLDTRSSSDSHITTGSHHSAFPSINGNYHSMLPPSTIPERRFSYDSSNSSRPMSSETYPRQFEQLTPMQPLPASSSHSLETTYSQNYASSNTNYQSSTVYNPLPPLPPFGFDSGYNVQNGDRGNILSPPTMTNANSNSYANSRSDSFTNYSNVMEMSTAPYTIPVFSLDEYGLNPSPPLPLNDDFLISLFGTNGMVPDSVIPSPPGPETAYTRSSYAMPLPKTEPDVTMSPVQPIKQERSKSPTANGLDIYTKESAVSDKKRLRLIDLINRRFSDLELPDRLPREAIMHGCVDDPKHVLSLTMQRTFLASYWAHVHQQMPILHRPTFNPETCPDLLLLAMMCLGASCLERGYALEMTQRCAELSSFLAYHIRWEVFKDAEFRPPGMLWTFQTLLLLEMFEKMYSTRVMHERAHIHHATTLTVMRRGSSLIGRSAIESPGHSNDPTRTPPGPDGSINTSGYNTGDANWNRWITAEATRRAAFAAFVIDSTHATLFGHSAVMAPHDIKLPLPCDEALWSATSGSEVERTEASLKANGFRPIQFLDGLRQTLNRKTVRTNTFGRVILMAGLLNVSWHMNQRDLQVNSLPSSALGSSPKWRSPLYSAIQFWRKDFDDASAPPYSSPGARDSVFESRTTLHSLALMAMHVDMIDCTVFAGSEKALGRSVTDADRAAVQRRMRDHWAPSAHAREAVYHAVRFLCEVLMPEDEQPEASTSNSTRPNPHQQPNFTYSARDDYLLNRPWVLYFATLIVWAWGYALDGPLSTSNHTLTAREQQISDMRRYLNRVRSVKVPLELQNLPDRNSCLGLLLLLRACFREPRWELLHDASDILDKCIRLLVPGQTGGGGPMK
jgi:hypothetical protein